ncbi:Cu2+-exporting ATPase [Defluviimonas denitrificans]|jgi:Cu2+-exporting ATPase|uniref:Cu2+-exporting ATPase n=2 Tax=Paracoccaceae TaxID=31989 RepID=A0A2S8S3S4_9RHOB|nr:copper-translocating P-type ATPase [Defluviimonas denitrificans]PQV55461.1 Cu2+-exporting ATPase [Defluviimonas denitrificans]HRK67025.1 copper-translocating P-type ATPase [Hyphomonas sp.]
MTNNAQKPDTPPPMAGMDHAAMGHGAKSSIDHAAMGLGAKSVDHAAMGHAPQGGGAHAGHGDMVADFRRRFWVCLVLTIPVLVLSPMVRDFLGQGMAPLFAAEEWVALALSSIIYFWGGWPFLTGALPEVRSGRPGMMTLVALAISTAYFYSAAVTLGLPGGEPFYWELATLVTIMLLGHWLEMRSVLGASRALEELVRLLPDTALRVKADGGTEEVPVAALVAGDRVVIRPGAKVPVDGTITEGTSSFNEAMLTGESKPVNRTTGETVIGGAVNGEGAVTIEVKATGEATYLSQVIAMVKAAQNSRSRTQDLATRAATVLTWVAITVGLGSFAYWVWAGESVTFALERMVTVMVIACPHALGLAVPLVVAVSTSLAAKNGLLIRDRAAFERARDLNAVVFDKTGTLTEGRFGVSDIVMLEGGDEAAALRMAASVESQSQHPIAQGIVAAATGKGIAFPAPEGLQSITGAGVTARVDGQEVAIVSPGHLRRQNTPVTDPRLAALEEAGKTVVVLVKDGKPHALFALADIVRAESRDVVARLRARGVQSIMMTGDAEGVAKSVAKELGLDEYFAQVLPDQKAAKVRELRARGLKVAMVGDGVNDAPALVEADLGIAIGAGTDVAVESADVVLVRSDPRDVEAILGLSRATYSKMVQNLIWATGYNAFAIPMAAGITFGTGFMMTPAVGAVFMSASTIIVAINAQLLRRYQG